MTPPSFHELIRAILKEVDDSGLTLRDIEARIPYGRTTVSKKLNGERRPDWPFITAVLEACAGGNRQVAAALADKIRPLWDGAAPARARSAAGRAIEQDREALQDVAMWPTMMRELARARQTVARLHQSRGKAGNVAHGLNVMYARLSAAAEELTAERDRLRADLAAQSDSAAERRRTRALLAETQHRLAETDRILAEVLERLDEALRLRATATRLTDIATRQASTARQRLTQLQQRAITLARPSRGDARAVPGGSNLMDEAGQAVAARILTEIDSALSAEEADLRRLHQELAGTLPGTRSLSAGRPSDIPAVRDADAIAQRYEALMHGAAQIIWVASPDGEMAEDCADWRRLSGQQPEEFLRDGWLGCVHPDELDRVTAAWREHLRSGEQFDLQARMRTHDSAYRHYEVRAVPVVRDGEIAEWAGACMDVTSQREAEDMRGRLTEQLSAVALRTARLQQATSRLAEALTVQEVVTAIAEVARITVGALRSQVATFDGITLRILNLARLDLGAPGRMVPRDTACVLTRAIDTLRPVFVTDTEDLLVQFNGKPAVEPERQDDESAWAALPMVSEDLLVGALRFSFGEPRHFSADERILLEEVAGQCALALERAVSYERYQVTPEALLRSLLPHALPSTRGLAIAARYLPAALGEVCGDWYDAFTVDPDRVAVAVGDVTGRGLTAVTGASRLGNALRTLALITPLPEMLLSGLDRAVTAAGPMSMSRRSPTAWSRDPAGWFISPARAVCRPSCCGLGSAPSSSRWAATRFSATLPGSRSAGRPRSGSPPAAP